MLSGVWWLAEVESANGAGSEYGRAFWAGLHVHEDQVDFMHQYVDSIVLFAVSLPLFSHHILLCSPVLWDMMALQCFC